MKKFFKSITKKLNSRSGFSMTELLVATIILGLVTVGLATGVKASLNVYNESVTYSEERVLLSTLSEAVISELRNAKDITDSSGKYVWSPAVPGTEGGWQNIGTYSSKKYGVNTSFDSSAKDFGRITMNNTQAATEDKKIKLVGNGAYHEVEDDKGNVSWKLEARMDPVQYKKDTDGTITLKTTVYVKAAGSKSDPEENEIIIQPLDQFGAAEQK